MQNISLRCAAFLENRFAAGQPNPLKRLKKDSLFPASDGLDRMPFASTSLPRAWPAPEPATPGPKAAPAPTGAADIPSARPLEMMDAHERQRIATRLMNHWEICQGSDSDLFAALSRWVIKSKDTSALDWLLASLRGLPRKKNDARKIESGPLLLSVGHAIAALSEEDALAYTAPALSVMEGYSGQRQEISDCLWGFCEGLKRALDGSKRDALFAEVAVAEKRALVAHLFVHPQQAGRIAEYFCAQQRIDLRLGGDGPATFQAFAEMLLTDDCAPSTDPEQVKAAAARCQATAELPPDAFAKKAGKRWFAHGRALYSKGAGGAMMALKLPKHDNQQELHAEAAMMGVMAGIHGAQQMGYFCSRDYIKDVARDTVRPGIYQAFAQVSAPRPQDDTWSDALGWAANRQDRDLGPHNGPFPITELVRALYLLTSSAVTLAG